MKRLPLMAPVWNSMSRVAIGAGVMAYDLKKLCVDTGEWDIMPDGRLFAIKGDEGEDDITVFNVVLNWLEPRLSGPHADPKSEVLARITEAEKHLARTPR